MVKGYRIRRGVKQGDSLSCILFVMCMKPLLKNIEKNLNIIGINSTQLQAVLPKVYGYADDVNCFLKNDGRSLQSLFDENERLTNVSGLELNANKT